MRIKIACIQINSGPEIGANIAKLEQMVASAVQSGAQLVALPENAFLIAGPASVSPRYRQEAHPAVAAAAKMAQKNQCWLLAGSMNIASDDSEKTVNRSLLFDERGQVIATYDKIHLFDVSLPNGEIYTESAKIIPGNLAVTANLPWGRLGLSICYDLRFPHLYRTLAKAGADIMAVPAAFTAVTGEAHWHVLLRARAIENSCFVIAPAQCGFHAGNRKTYGHSLIIDPWGNIIADGGVEEGIITAELDLAQVKEIRARLPSLQHDRIFSMENIDKN